MDDANELALLGYKLYWKRIGMHLNLRDIAADIGARSTEISAFEKGDLSKLTEEQIRGYLAKLELDELTEAFLKHKATL